MRRHALGLVDALRLAGAEPGIISDGGRARWRRQPAKIARALRPGVRMLHAADDGYCARDIFREAQVHFRLYGRVLRLRVPGPAGIVHWSYPVPLWIEGWHNLYTIHDLIPLDARHRSPVHGGRLHRLIASLVARGARLVTVSSGVAEAVAAVFGIDPGRVRLCPQGVSVDVDGAAAAGSSTPSCAPPGPYHLSAATSEPRKNLPRLVSAFRACDLEASLLLAGGIGSDEAALQAAIGGDPRIVRLGHLPRDELVTLMARARSLLFPSLAEGFGLPIAEAMTLGTPVVTARGGATEEVAAGAALLVDAADAADIARAITQVDGDAALRGRLRDAGLARAAFFAPAAYAGRLLTLYEDAWHGR